MILIRSSEAGLIGRRQDTHVPIPQVWTPPPVPTYLGFNDPLEQNARKSLIRLLGNATEYTTNATFPMTENDHRMAYSSLPSMITHLLALYAWRAGVGFLSQEIEYFWEQAIIGPSVEDFGRLKAARKYAEKLCRDFNVWLGHVVPLLRRGLSRSEDTYMNELNDLPIQISNLKQEINDTFQLLIGAIAIRDSEIQKQLARESRLQARRATALTALAAVYLPLSLTTGVFGMNITEINQGTPKYWAVLALGVGLLMATLPFLLWVFFDKDDDDQDRKKRSMSNQRRDGQESAHSTTAEDLQGKQDGQGVKDRGSGILRRRTTTSSRMSQIVPREFRSGPHSRDVRSSDMV